MKIKLISHLTVIALLVLSPLASTEEILDQKISAVGIDQNLGKTLPLDAVFADETGLIAPLGRYFSDKPVILTPVYYECPMLCTLTLNGFLKSITALGLTAGREFEIVTFSIDSDETPALARIKKKAYLAQYARPGAENGWHFLTGSRESVERLTQALGFKFFYDQSSDEFAHASSIMVATAQGKISRYFTGIEYASKDIRLALVEASANKIGTVLDRIFLLCFHYNPETGKYSLAITHILRIMGALTVIILGGGIAFMLKNEKKLRTKTI